MERKNETLDDYLEEKKSFRQKFKEIWNDYSYELDLPALVLAVISAIYLTYIITNYSQSLESEKLEMARLSGIVFNLLICGLVFYLLVYVGFKQTKIEQPEGYTISDTRLTIIFVAIFLVVEYIIQNYISKIELSVIQLTEQYFFYISIAIAETIVFSTLFQIIWERLTKQPIVGIIIHAVAFMLYHVTVYGDEPSQMIAVFLSGLNFALAVKISKKLSVPIIIHIIVNILAYGLLMA